MDELKRQVARAHRRLMLQRFLTVLAWSLFATFALATVAIAVPKVWALGVDSRWWVASWLGGALFGGCLFTGVWAYVTRRSPLDAAIEIDRRFGLKERVSSTVALSAADLQTEVGEALVRDASRRVARLDVGEQFQIRSRWFNLLPLAPAAAAFLVAVILPDAVRQPTATAGAVSLDVRQRVQNSTEELQKKWAEQKKKAEEQDLEAAKLFTELEKGVGELTRSNNIDRKKALIKLNDLAEEIEKRRSELGDMNKLQQQLNQLKNLKPGPASELSKAMKQGDFSRAISEVNDLKNELANGTMTDKQRQALAEQLRQMADKMKQTAAAHDMAKQELRKQIEQARKAGDNAQAGELQRKLDRLNAQNQQMKQLQKMAQKMAECSQSAGRGQAQQAANQLDALAADLEELRADLEEMELLDEALDQLADAKDCMNCDQCDGMGCANCLGNGGLGQRPGMGLGDGRGVGDRPEAETDKQFYDSQVRGKVGKGKAVVTGYASGKNIAGDALEEVKEAIESARSETSDPLTNVRVPKEHRDYARDYFDAFNDR